MDTRWIAFILARMLATSGITWADEAPPEGPLAPYPGPVCAEIDLASDELGPTQRPSARGLLVRALEAEGRTVATEGCAEIYRVSHRRRGERLLVRLAGPQGAWSATAAPRDLPEVYRKLVRRFAVATELVAGPITTEAPPPALPPATVAAAAPDDPEVAPDRLWYFRFGTAALAGTRVSAASGASIGYRHETDPLAVDLSIAWASGGANDGGGYAEPYVEASSMSVAAEILRVFAPTASRSFYAGGGLSFGTVRVVGEGEAEGQGGQGELTAGYELLRDWQHLRLFAQADVTLPFYTLREESARWVPTLAVSLGLGFQR